MKAKLSGRILMLLYWVFYLKYKVPDDYLGVIEVLNTPFKVATWLYNNIEYEKDPEDEWQSPMKLFERRKGDCEDYMIFAGECLKEGNYFLVYGEDVGHATYLMKNEDRGYVTIGTHGYVVHGKVIEDVATFFITDWTKWYVMNKKEDVVEEGKKIKDIQS